jgi:hypothetical protein
MLNGPVLGAVGGSAGFLVTTLTVPALRNALGLGRLSPFGWLLVGAGALSAVAGNRLLPAIEKMKEEG